jgi:hypothetical protein
MKRELDARSRRDEAVILQQLLWTAWPTVWSQDQ